MADEFNLETRFSKSRGMFPYVAAILGAAVLVLAFMYLTGIGREPLPYSAYFERRAPAAADGSEALSLQTLTPTVDPKMITIEGTVMNRTDDAIADLEAMIAVADKFTLPVQTVNVPVEPAPLPPKGIGTFRTTVMLGENGFGSFSINFRLADNGPFVPHKDERPDAPPALEPEPQSEKQPAR
jgi:hypothetical protein